MNIDSNQVFSELKKIKVFLRRNPRYNILLDYINDFDNFNAVFRLLTGYELSSSDLFNDEKSIRRVANKYNNRQANKYIDIVDENEELILSIFRNFDKMLINAEYEDIPVGNWLKTYSEKEFKDILLCYFSLFGSNVYKTVKKYFDEGRIQTHIPSKDNYSGQYFGSRYLKTGYITSVHTKLDTLNLSSIAHELGHAVDRELFIYSQQKKLTIADEVLLEVPSAFYELEFLEFLKNNYIDRNGANLLINDRCGLIKEYRDDIESTYSEPGGFVDFDENFVIERDGEETTYELRDGLHYGLGYYYGFHLCEQFENEPSTFNKIFFDFISSRKERTISEGIKSLGYDIDEFTSSDIILPRIKDSTLELKKRYYNHE